MSELLLGLLALLGVVVTAAVTWLLGRRSTSGTVATSDAASLWTESQAMRADLRTEVADLRTALTDSGAKLDAAIARITDLLHKVELSNVAAEAARAETALSRLQTAALQSSIDAVHKEVVTGNSLTMGALADNAESRRIGLIPEAQRTRAETRHIADVGIKGADPKGADHE